MFSYFRFAIIVVIGLVALYLAVSFRFPRLISFNNLAAFTIISATVVLEIGLRAVYLFSVLIVMANTIGAEPKP